MAGYDNKWEQTGDNQTEQEHYADSHDNECRKDLKRYNDNPLEKEPCENEDEHICSVIMKNCIQQKIYRSKNKAIVRNEYLTLAQKLRLILTMKRRNKSALAEAYNCCVDAVSAFLPVLII